MITVVGGTGFVGIHLIAALKEQGLAFQLLARTEEIIEGRELGSLIYCAGYGGCDDDPFNVLDANAVLLGNLISKCSILKIVYLSSTRLYIDNKNSNEDADLKISVQDNRKLFNLSKLIGEELIIKSKLPFVILRSSNIYGDAFDSPLFLPSIVRDSLIKGEVKMFITPEYAKDYVSVFDLVEAIIASLNRHDMVNEVVNIASGENVSASRIADVLVAETKTDIAWCGKSVDDIFPITDISKMRTIFQITPRKVLEDLPKMVSNFRLKLDK